MTLPSSGQISHDDIHKELYGSAPSPGDGVRLGDMSRDAEFTVPDKESDFYGYTTPPPFILVLSVNNGVTQARTIDSGNNWATLANPVTGSTVPAMVADKDLTNILQANYSTSAKALSASTNAGATWFSTGSALTNYIATAVGWILGSYWYAVTQSGTLRRGTKGNTLSTSYSVGVSPVSCLATGGSYVFAGANSLTGLRRSTNNGSGWATITGSNIANLTSICCSDNGQYVYFAKSGEVHRSTSYGASSSFTREFTTFIGQTNMRISCDSTGQYVLVKGNSKVFLSSNSGGSWTDITSSMPGPVINDTVYNGRYVSYSGEHMLVITNNRLYVSWDFGVNWAELSHGFSQIGAGLVEAATAVVAPICDFYASPTDTDTNTTVSLHDTSQNGPTTWAWAFGPSTPTFVQGDASSQNPKVKFPSPGVYSVTLTVTNSAGNGALTKTDYITIVTYIPVPVTDFSADQTEVAPETTVQFTDLSTNTPTSWEWNVLDGINGVDFDFIDSFTSQNPRIKFNTPGYYTINLEACNAGGCELDQKYHYIHVTNLLATGVISYWKFTNAALTDFAGSNNGVANGNLAGSPGLIDQSIYLSGGPYIQIPCKAGATCGVLEYNDFTISLWTKQVGGPVFGAGIFSKMDNYCSSGNTTDWSIYQYLAEGLASAIAFQVGNSNNSGVYTATYAWVLSSSVWTHIVGVKNGTSIKLYINGILRRTVPCDSTIQFTNTPIYMGRIECWNNTAGYFYKGNLDEIGFWSRGLSDTEVSLLYNNGDGFQYPFT